MKNEFQNEKERIEELKMCLEESFLLLDKGESMMARTLIRDVLSRYEEDKKFLTASTNRTGPFEFLDD